MKIYIWLFVLVFFSLEQTNAQKKKLNQIFGPDNVCVGQTASYSAGLVLCGPDMNYYYSWDVNGGSIIGSSSGAQVNITWTSAGNKSVGVQVTCSSDGGIGGSVYQSLNVTVSGSLAAPELSDGYVCDASQSVTLSVNNPISGYTYKWYTTPTGGTNFYEGETYNAQGANTFYVAAENGSCISSRTQVKSIITDPPEYAPGLRGGTAICNNNEVLLTAIYIQSGTESVSFNWYKVVNNLEQSVLAGSAHFSTSEAGTYRVKAFYENCDEGPANEFNITNASKPEVNITPLNAVGNQIIDEGNTLVRAVVENIPIGTEYYWSYDLIPSLTDPRADVEQFLQDGQQIHLFAYNGCWSDPVTYTAVGDKDSNLNWALSKTFDENGNVAASAKTYFDANAGVMQKQVKKITEERVFATQPVYDNYGRKVISTLPAPIEGSFFAYKEGFITSNNGEGYTEDKFDLPVDQTTEGTLGHFYGSLSEESLNATTGYPYQRIEYFDDGRGGVKRSAFAGDAFKLGAEGNHQVFSYRFPLLQEMDHYLSVKYDHVFPNADNRINTLAGFGFKQVSRDLEGNEIVTFHDADGNNIASAKVGGESNQHVVNLQKNVNIAEVYWANFEYKTKNNDLQINVKGAETVQVFRSFDGTNYQLMYNGPSKIVGQESELGMIISIRTESDPIDMFIQVRSDQSFTLSKKIELKYDFVHNADEYETFNTISSIKWEEIKDVKSLKGENVYEFHIPKNQTNVSFDNPGGYALDLKLIKLDGNLPEEEIYANSWDISDNPFPLLDKGFYRLTVNTITQHWPFAINYNSMKALTSYNYPMSDLSYSFYDLAKEQVVSISAKGVNDLMNDENYSDIDKRTNEYNSTATVIAKTSIDEGLDEAVYRKDGGLRFAQDANQKLKNTFSYVAYDKFGRSIESGEYRGTDKVFENHKGTGGNNSVLSIIENTDENNDYINGLRKTDCFDVTKTVYDLQVDGSGRIQNYIEGGVSYTEKINEKSAGATHKTWYSYDEFGRTEWIVKYIEGIGLKTIDYEHNYFGNVTQVIYQKETIEEAFYHKYEYDADQRLTIVYTKRGNEEWQEHVKYIYNLNGRIKRVEVGDELQGVDYIYTLNGRLKSINNIDLSKDQDGNSNNFGKDIFNLQLDYYSGDYTSAQTNNPIKQLDYSNLSSFYNGNISSASWSTQKPGELENSTIQAESYAYGYDDKNQVSSARFGNINLTNHFEEALNKTYNLEDLSYDLNGNILNLKRYDENGISDLRDDFTYTYDGHTNKLKEVSGYAQYAYDASGQMVLEHNTRKNKTFSLTYNSSNLVTEVKDELGNSIASYQYDERGFRTQKAIYNLSGETHNTYYVRDVKGSIVSIYEKVNVASTEQVELPIYGTDRIGSVQKIDGEWETLYELKDHLGNVRAVYKKGKPIDNTYYTSIENGTIINNEPAQSGDIQFEVGNKNPIGILDNQIKRTGSMSVRLQGSVPDQKYGPFIWIPVKKSDNVHAQIYHLTQELPGSTGRIGGEPGNIVDNNAIINMEASPSGQIGGENKNSSMGMGVNLLSLADNKALNRGGIGLPIIEYYTAFLRLELYENKDDAEPVEVREARVSVRGEEQLGLWLPIEVEWDFVGQMSDLEEGFIKASILNEGDKKIWFDDFTVQHNRNASKVEVVSYKDYYPFGAIMKEGSNNFSRFGFQGQYAEEDRETGWSHFELRSYDPLIGRFISPDPAGQFASPYMGMGNNPVVYIDPDGAIVPNLIMGGIGALVGATYGVLSGKSGKEIAALAVGGFVGGFTAGLVGGAVLTAVAGTSSFMGAVGTIGGANALYISMGAGVVGGVAGGTAEQVTKVINGASDEINPKEIYISGVMGVFDGLFAAFSDWASGAIRSRLTGKLVKATKAKKEAAKASRLSRKDMVKKLSAHLRLEAEARGAKINRAKSRDMARGMVDKVMQSQNQMESKIIESFEFKLKILNGKLIEAAFEFMYGLPKEKTADEIEGQLGG